MVSRWDIIANSSRKVDVWLFATGSSEEARQRHKDLAAKSSSNTGAQCKSAWLAFLAVAWLLPR